MGSSGTVPGMTRQYVAGELSALLAHVQAVTTTEEAGQDAWSLRHAAETEPIQVLPWVTVQALALTEWLCWDSLNRGDTAAFTRQAAVCAELHEFGVCAGLIVIVQREDKVMAEGQESQDSGARVSEAQIAVHWREEQTCPPPPGFVEQANAADPAIFDRFSEEHFPDCFAEYADLLTWGEPWHTTLDIQ
jgi:hypothetical protein